MATIVLSELHGLNRKAAIGVLLNAGIAYSALHSHVTAWRVIAIAWLISNA